MAAETIDLGRWQDTVRQLLPRELTSMFTGAPRRELLKQVGATVLVFDDLMVELGSGRQARLPGPGAVEPDSLARTAAELLGPDATDPSVVLLLPPHEFVATAVTLPGMTRETLLSALRLQAESLLPSFTEKLAVVANPHDADDLHADVALWITEQRLDQLYQAFQREGMFLSAILPRCAALVDAAGSQEILDEDQHFLTSLSVEDGVIVRWLHVSRKDLEQDIFDRQWRQAQAVADQDSRVSVDSGNFIQRYAGVDVTQAGFADYCFFPDGALRARRQVEKGKRAMFAVAALALVILLGSLPFLFQTLASSRLQSRLEEQRSLSSAARADREVVQRFEEEWGVITNFPQQDVVQTLFTLQSVLSPEQLSSLELSEGIIRIEGESAEPQAILQRLEQHPMFTEVAFSRATNNTRYYIDLRLSTVNFEGYMVRYFPDN